MALPALGSVLGGIGRAAARTGMQSGINAAREGARGAVRSAVTRAVKGRGGRVNRESSPLYGVASAVKGAAGGGGSDGGSPISSSIVPAPRSESSLLKSTSVSILDELRSVKSVLSEILKVEQETTAKLQDQIIDYEREEEKKKRTEEQERLESGKTKRKQQKDNPIVAGAKSAVKGLWGFISDFVSDFIKFKVLRWIADPKNRKNLTRIVEFFQAMFKAMNFVWKFVLEPIIKPLLFLTAGALKIISSTIVGLIDFFSFKWFPNPQKFVDSVLGIPKAIFDTIPKIIKSILNFLTFGLFKEADEGAEEAISNTNFESQEVSQSTDQTEPTPQQSETKKNPIQAAGDFVGNAIGTVGNAIGAIANPIGAIGNFVGGMFGGGQKKDAQSPDMSDLPQLAEGGIVSPESTGGKPEVKPLTEMVSIAGLSKMVGDSISPFLDMLTAPFKIIGTALVGIALKTISKIPFLGDLLKPVIMMMAESFGVPKEVLTLLQSQTTAKDLSGDRAGEGTEEYDRPIPGEESEKDGDGFDLGKIFTNPLGAASDLIGNLLPGPAGQAVKSIGNFLSNPAGAITGGLRGLIGGVVSSMGGTTPSPTTPGAPDIGTASPTGTGRATFGDTGNVSNAAGWVHGHFQTNTGTAEDVVNDVAPMVKKLSDDGVPVELSNGTKLKQGSSMDEVKKFIRSGISQHRHSGDGRSVDIFVPKGTKVPFPLSDVKAYGGREGVSGVLPGSGKVWVGHLTRDSKSGAVPHTAPKESNAAQLSQQTTSAKESVKKTSLNKTGAAFLNLQQQSMDLEVAPKGNGALSILNSGVETTSNTTQTSVGSPLGSTLPQTGLWSTYKTRL